MEDQFSPGVKEIITYSKEAAHSNGVDYIGTEHLLIGLFNLQNTTNPDDLISYIFDKLNVKTEELKKQLEQKFIKKTGEQAKNLHLTRQAERALKTTFLEAKLFKSLSILPAHLLLTITRNENDPSTKFLMQNGINYDYVKSAYKDYQATYSDYFINNNSPYLSLYFMEDEYTSEEIAEVISFLSDLYKEEGGDGLVIKGNDILEFESFLEPLLA
ncbi:MAG: Clp protease N-terminal domain-containing protein [Winogradskyella sp.]